MNKLSLMLATFGLSVSALASYDQAPPSFSYNDGKAVFVDIQKSKVVEFTTYCNTFNLNNRQFSEKFNELKHKNIELNFYSLTMKIDTKREKISIQNLEMMLRELTNIVKINKFEPILITELKNE